MNKPVRTKLCWNCEGSVSRSVENCPYCGVYLSPEDSESPLENLVDSSQSTYPKEQEIPKAPYTPPQDLSNEMDSELLVGQSSIKGIFLPILFLSAGTLLLLFSCIVLLFSSQGTLTLVWNEEQWLYFLLLSIPCLLIGYKLTSE